MRVLEEFLIFFGDSIALGAGTVLNKEEVHLVKRAGGEFIISPNMDIEVIKETKNLGLLSMPGCYTPSEIFTAQKLGADIIKVFPVSSLSISYLKSINAVLPKETKICPTGGIDHTNLRDYFENAKVFAVGIGSSLYKPGKSLENLKEDALKTVKAFKAF